MSPISSGFGSSEHLTQIRHLEQALARVTAEIVRRFTPPSSPGDEPSARQKQEAVPEMMPDSELPSAPQAAFSWSAAVVWLWSIPGSSERTARGILAESGIQMQHFPSAAQLASWAGVCPGNHESAGKRLSGKTRPGNPWLRCLVVQAAHAASHQKHGDLAEHYRRRAKRRGSKRAAVAVAHRILVMS